MRKITLGVQGSHATGTCRCDRLTIVIVGHVASRKDSFGTGDRPIGLRPSDVSVCMGLDLPTEEHSVRRMADRKEHSGRF